MLTNRLNLPQSYCLAVDRVIAGYSGHKRKDGRKVFRSVTELIDSARLVALKRRHAGEITGDYADHAYVLAGSIGHGVLEQASGRIPAQTAIESLYELFDGILVSEVDSVQTPAMPLLRGVQDVLAKYSKSRLGDIQEIRLYAEVHGQLISGQPDLVRRVDHRDLGNFGSIDLADWKFCKRFATLHGVKLEWQAQLNVYRWLCHQNKDLLISRGMNPDLINTQSVFAYYKDWSEADKRKQGDDYPEFMIEPFDVEMWPLDTTEGYVRERVALHELAQDVSLPHCSKEERWVRDESWGVINIKTEKCIKRKRLDGTYMDEMDAEVARLSMAQPENYRIEYKEGRAVRCEDGWCPVAPFCSQYQAQFQSDSREL